METIGKPYLLQEGVVDDLVAKDRTPWLEPVPSPNGSKQIVVFVPPQGTQLGDIALRIKDGYEILSQQGTLRGNTSSYTYTRADATELMGKIAASVQKHLTRI